MPMTHQQREDLDSLLFALRDGGLETAGHARLEQLVLEHAEAQERFVVSMYLQASLHWKFAGRPADVVEPANVELPRTARMAEAVSSGRGMATWMGPAAVLLAVVLGAAFLAWRRPSEADAALARVTKVSNVRFNGPAVAEGSTLTASRGLDLAQGLVEITFNSGARVVLEGPARFEVLSSTRGRLAEGTLTARAPPELKGFVVETPSLTLLDLGTEFGVRANRSGTSEVHVFDGAVEAEPTSGQPQAVMLRERQAIQCDSQTGALEDVIFDEERFVRDVYRAPPAAAAAPDFAETFDDLDHLQLQRGYKCADVRTSLSADAHQGQAAVQIDWQAAADNYGVVYLAKKVPATDVTGCSFAVWVKPLSPNSGYWGIELFDDRGEMVEQHRVFALKVGQWNQLVFQQGEQTRGGYFHAGPGDLTRIGKIVLRAQTREGAQSASDLWDDFKLIGPP